MPVFDVWFWMPFHMLQAYPMARNLPLPDILIPFAHLIWVPFYIWEHWAGLCEPVAEAWAMKSVIVPLSGVLLLSFFYFSHQLSDNKVVVKIGFILYFSFMLGAGPVFGFTGSPKKTYIDQTNAIEDPDWNDQHLFLHIWYLVILWAVALTVPQKKLSALRAGMEVEPSEGVSNAPIFFQSLLGGIQSNSNSIENDITLMELFKEVLYGEHLVPEFSSISQTSKFLLLQGLMYAATGLTMFFLPNSVFNKVMFFPEPFTSEELPLYRVAGFTLFAVGFYFMTLSRTDHPYWIIVSIFPRICFVIPAMIILYTLYGAPIQLTGTFFVLDLSLAYLTFLSMKYDTRKKSSGVVDENTSLIT